MLMGRSDFSPAMSRSRVGCRGVRLAGVVHDAQVDGTPENGASEVVRPNGRFAAGQGRRNPQHDGVAVGVGMRIRARERDRRQHQQLQCLRPDSRNARQISPFGQ